MSAKAGSFWSRPSSSFAPQQPASPASPQASEQLPFWRSPFGLAVAVGLALVGFIRGAHPINDNSMFTHLRTGMDMARTGAIPRHDPYSFTAHGHPWVVQSWFPEWTYGWIHRIGGFQTVVLEQSLLMVGLVLLLVALARAGTPLRTLVAAGITVGFGAPWWSQRPLLFGLIAFALTILVVERGWSRWWLIPIVWLWVNSHGSFPLGVLWFGTRAVGEAIDLRDWPRRTLHYAVGFGAGLVASILNPLGPRLLTFPLTALDKRNVFKHIIEWFSPNFQQQLAAITLIFLFGALIVLFRRGVRWYDVVPVTVFLAIALIAQRNLGPAGVVLAPALGHAMQTRPGERMGPKGEFMPVAVAAAIIISLQYLFWGVGIYRKGGLNLKGYPVAAVAFLEDNGLRTPDHHVLEQDRVGNYLDAKFGSSARVFVDDRYDMFPTEISDDYFNLLKGEPDWPKTLDKYGVDVVLWDERTPLGVDLANSDQWDVVFHKKPWVVFQKK